VLVGQLALNDDSRQPPVHTGVTAVIPHAGDQFNEKLIAAVHTINGFGKPTGFEQIRETGTLETPIILTNTLCVGHAWDGLVTWMLDRHPEIGTSGPSVNPVVAECNDSRLNDLRGRHITASHVLDALHNASSGPVDEGCAGAGAGMVCYGWKGGVGTASRQLEAYTIGVLLNANFGQADQLMVRGVPVGRLLSRGKPCARPALPGSVVILLATDAPLTSRQLGRLARRATAGLARTGSMISHGSGDFVITFSTAQRISQTAPDGLLHIDCLPDTRLDRFFQAVVESVEEAVLNALCAAVPTRGYGSDLVESLPVDRVREILSAHPALS
jgi:D-aminopeptidase